MELHIHQLYAKNAKKAKNAITPQPNWQTLTTSSRVNNSALTSPSLSETDYNAINFWLWKQISMQILIKSNINNWLVCNPGTGSLVDMQNGTVKCQIIKRVTDKCNATQAPSKFTHVGVKGPLFYSHHGFASRTKI